MVAKKTNKKSPAKKRAQGRASIFLADFNTPEAPIGSIAPFCGAVTAAMESTGRWMLCDGRSLNRNEARFAPLFNAIGTAWGGDANPNFNIPDLRGRFLRGVDKDVSGVPTPAGSDGLIRDPERDGRAPANPDAANPANQGNRANNVGSMQNDAFQGHIHVDSGHSHPYKDIRQTDHQFADGGRDVRAMRDATDSDRVSSTVSANIGGPVQVAANIPLRIASAETRVKNAYVYWIIRYR